MTLSLPQNSVLKLWGQLARAHPPLFSNRHLLSPNPQRGPVVPRLPLHHMTRQPLNSRPSLLDMHAHTCVHMCTHTGAHAHTCRRALSSRPAQRVLCSGFLRLLNHRALVTDVTLCRLRPCSVRLRTLEINLRPLFNPLCVLLTLPHSPQEPGAPMPLFPCCHPSE